MKKIDAVTIRVLVQLDPMSHSRISDQTRRMGALSVNVASMPGAQAAMITMSRMTMHG